MSLKNHRFRHHVAGLIPAHFFPERVGGHRDDSATCIGTERRCRRRNTTTGKTTGYRGVLKIGVGAALAALLFTLAACEEAVVGPSPITPPATPPPSDAPPTFGGVSIPDQRYMVNAPIPRMVLPPAAGSSQLSYGFSSNVPGLTFAASSRELSGTPTAAGQYQATYTVTDATGGSESLRFAVLVSDATGTLDVQSDPEGATIYLNGVDTGQTTPATLEVVAGGHQVVLVVPNLVSFRKTVAVQAGQRTSVVGTFEFATGLSGDEPDVPSAPDVPPPRHSGARRLQPASATRVDLSDHFPAVRDQGRLGSCAAFATANLVSYNVAVDNDADVVMSPAFLWTVRNPKPGTKEMFNRLTTYGISSELQTPYGLPFVTNNSAFCSTNSADPGCWDPPTQSAIDQAVDYRVPAGAISRVGCFSLYSDGKNPWCRVKDRWLTNNHRNNEIKAWLDGGYPLYFSVEACKLAESGKQSPYIWGKDQTKGCSRMEHEFGHAVVIVGYDDDKGKHGAFKILNSWGNKWGESGYGWVGYDIGLSFTKQAYVIYPYNPIKPVPEPYFPDGTRVPAQTYTAGSSIAPLTLPAAHGGSGSLNYRLKPSIPGLSFNSATRTLSGTPTTAKTYSMTYEAAVDAAAVPGDALSFDVTVRRPSTSPLSFGNQRIEDRTYTVDAPISTLRLPAATGGKAPLRYSLTPVPNGLTFDVGARTLTGTPRVVGTSNLTYRVTDASGNSASLSFAIEVQSTAPPSSDATLIGKVMVLTVVQRYTSCTVPRGTVVRFWFLDASTIYGLRDDGSFEGFTTSWDYYRTGERTGTLLAEWENGSRNKLNLAFATETEGQGEIWGWVPSGGCDGYEYSAHARINFELVAFNVDIEVLDAVRRAIEEHQSTAFGNAVDDRFDQIGVMQHDASGGQRRRVGREQH